MYSDPILDTVIRRLDADGPKELRGRYYQGDPVVLIGSNEWPICFVSKDTTTITADTTMDDLHRLPLVLNVVYNGVQDLNQKAFSQAGALGLYRLCEGRGDDYNLLDDTIAHVLRSSQVLNGDRNLFIDVDTEMTIEYVLSPPERRGLFSVEAVIKTTLMLQTER